MPPRRRQQKQPLTTPTTPATVSTTPVAISQPETVPVLTPIAVERATSRLAEDKMDEVRGQRQNTVFFKLLCSYIFGGLSRSETKREGGKKIEKTETDPCCCARDVSYFFPLCRNKSSRTTTKSTAATTTTISPTTWSSRHSNRRRMPARICVSSIALQASQLLKRAFRRSSRCLIPTAATRVSTL